jgi:hypothetical protein
MIRVDSLLLDRTHSLFTTERVNKAVLSKERLVEVIATLLLISEMVPLLTLINRIPILQIHQAPLLIELKISLDRYLLKEIASIHLNLDLTRKEHQRIHGIIAKKRLEFQHKAIDKMLI